MNWQLLWFVLAGFVLGFALSTLWEWFYFRRERMSVSDERIDELEAQLRAYEERDREQATTAPPWTAPTYQSPGVLLESEQTEETVELAGQDGLTERSESLVSRVSGDEDAARSGPDAAESDIEQRDDTTVVAKDVLFVDGDAVEDDPSVSDTVHRTAVAGAAIAATAVTAAALSDADEAGEDVVGDDISEDRDSSDSTDAGPEATQNFVSPDPNTDSYIDDDIDIPLSEELLPEIATAAGIVTVDTVVAEKLDEPVSDAIIESPNEQKMMQSDEFDAALGQDTIDDVIDESADDQSDEQSTILSDDKIARTVGESVVEVTDEQTVAPDDGPALPAIQDVIEEPTLEQRAVSIDDESDVDDDIAAPVDEAAAEFVDERYDTLAERPVVAEIDEQSEVVDVEPTEVSAHGQNDGLLGDDEASDFAPLRVDDLAPMADPVERAADIPDELLGAASLASAVGAAEIAGPEPGTAPDESVVWKPEEIRGHPDNLSRIKGIGKIYRARLYEAGVFTWHQLGQMSEDEIREIVNPFVSADVEEWPKRARELAERNGRIGAQYVGPPPDDLMEIRGIGSYAMQRLYKSGIWSFPQLAAKTPEELEAILPVSPSGEAIDYQRWIIIASEKLEERNG